MKKLTLLTLSALTSAALYADVAVQVQLQEADQELLSGEVVLTAENPTAIINQDKRALKVVLKQEEPTIVLDVSTIDEENNETLIAQPELAVDVHQPATLELADESNSLVITVNTEVSETK